MKTIYISDKTQMTLESMKNIDENHSFYDSFYAKEVEDSFICNVFGNAKVFGKAKVLGNAEVFGSAEICGYARVYDNARIYGYARVFGEARICGYARICGDARIYGDAEVHDDARVYGNARVFGDARVFGEARICGYARVCGDAEVTIGTYNLNFLRYNVTLTDNHIQIGCKQFTYEKALKLSKRDIGNLFSEEEYNDVINNKKLIVELIKRKRPDLFNINEKENEKENENGKVFE